MNPTDITQGLLENPNAFSILALFWQSHFVVKIVMIGLLSVSIWCWAIIVDKTILYSRTRKQMNRFEKVFWSGQSLDELYNKLANRSNQYMAALFVTAMREWKRSHEGSKPAVASLQQRIDRAMYTTVDREVERLQSKLLVLATVGSAAPFVGLFGTVWGIMNSFQSIAVSKSTNLAVVAPGIAEALLATALGLLAAIPAVIAFNKFSAEAELLGSRLDGFVEEFSSILSRQIDERA